MREFAIAILGLLVAACAGDNRAMGTQVDDAAIEVQARAYVTGADAVKGHAHIIITSVNGVVLLTGEADSLDVRDNILNEVRTLANVRRVVNEIRIAEPSSFGARSRDKWITTKVKSRLLGASDIRSARLEIVTTDRSVYMLGLVSKQEADAATEVVRRVDGVERVVRLFEYIE